jgi:hypothetical protein
VLDFEDQVKLVIVLDDHPRTKLGGGNRHGKAPCMIAQMRKKIGLGPSVIVNE